MEKQKNKAQLLFLFRIYILFILTFLIQVKSYSQTLIKEVKFPDLDKISCDRYGNVYVSNQSGVLKKFDEQGLELLSLAPPKPARIHVLEAWNSIRIFAFYRDFQEYLLTDRFLSQNPLFKINPDLIGYARTMTLSTERNFWILDDADYSLKKIDATTDKDIFRTPLDLSVSRQEFDITFIREYQNFLYLADRLSGILVFDNMGNYKKRLPYKEIRWMGFLGDEMYFVKDDQLIFFHLYELSERKISLFEVYKKHYTQAMVGENNLYLFHEHGFDVYKKE